MFSFQLQLVESSSQKATFKSSKTFFNQLQDQRDAFENKKSFKRSVNDLSAPKTAKKFKL